MAHSIDKLSATLHPILRIRADHQSGLIVKRGILTIHTGFENKIALDWQMKEVAIVSNVSIKCFAPEIGFGTAAYEQFSAFTLR